jgi:hypothetical protein
MPSMSESRKKPGVAFWATVAGIMQTAGYWVLVLVLLYVCFALFNMRTHGWPYFGP